ncbi:STAS domain-containing protein [Blastococcus sp. URHD0036]|uniref:STAS domain-containing protein n=1 Tax=Blastococcus sp. URHD0036 TaxID=1380356 RepID=UPI00068B021A|nr:STAS domain-containing protein [Blastococcus sp. URHD0036]
MSELPRPCPGPGSLTVSVDVTAALVTLSGELDCCSAADVGDVVPVLSAGRSVDWWLDAGGLTFCDGAGLAALLDLREQAARHGATLHLVGAGRCVRRIIDLVGLADRLPVEDAVPRPRPLSELRRRPPGSRSRPPQPV